MSKAELPSMTWAALRARTADGASEIGYQTKVEAAADGGVILRHHGRIVALIAEHGIALGTNGVHARMLTQRLNAVLHAAGVPYAIGIRGRTTCLFEGDFTGPIVARNVLNVSFYRVAGGAWNLQSLDTEGVAA